MGHERVGEGRKERGEEERVRREAGRASGWSPVRPVGPTFEAFALEGLGHDAGGLVLDLLGLPEGLAQLLHVVAVHDVRVPPARRDVTMVTRATHNNG